MSQAPKGKSKSGKGVGKGGKSVPKRYKRVLHNAVYGIGKPAIRRLSRRAGIKRISGEMYDEVRGALKTFLEDTIRESVILMEHSKRKTVTGEDVVHTLKRQGRQLYTDLKPPKKRTRNAKNE
jgi:histone H4